MKRTLCIALMLIGLSLCTPAQQAHAESSEPKELKDLSREKKLFRNYSGEGSNSVSSFCIEGHVFVMVTGDTSNVPSIVQVYEDKNGRVVPKKCN